MLYQCKYCAVCPLGYLLLENLRIYITMYRWIEKAGVGCINYKPVIKNRFCFKEGYREDQKERLEK